MCGIAACIALSSSYLRPEDDVIQNVLNSIRHRGPDNSDFYCSRSSLLLSTRLSITDPSHMADMPMTSVDGSVHLIFNGEIYNCKELNSKYGIETRLTNSDTEYILSGYQKYGSSIFSMLNGIFSIVLIDDNTNCTYVVRDPLGVKPVYLYKSNSALFVASEIKALSAFNIKLNPDKNTIYRYLVSGSYDDSLYTFFDGVISQEAGTYLKINGELISHHRYHDRNSYVDTPSNYKDTVVEFRRILSDSIVRQSNTNDFSVNISGGIDSRVLLDLLNEKERIDPETPCFTYSFDESGYDEWDDVSQLSSLFPIKPRRVVVSDVDIKDLLIESIPYLEQPFPGYPTLAKFKLFQQAYGNTGKVFLEGQGGDEISGGYKYVVGPYFMQLESSLYQMEFKKYCLANNLTEEELSSLIRNTSERLRGETLGSADGTLSSLAPYLNYEFFDLKQPSSLIPTYEVGNQLTFALDRDIYYTKLPRILRACDRTSMAFSKELRVPFLDLELVAFARSVNHQFRFRKGLHRSFFLDCLPSNLRRKGTGNFKKYVSDPQSLWLWKNNRNLINELIDDFDNLYTNAFYKKELLLPALRNTIDQPKPPRNSVFLWQFMCLEYWMRYFVIPQNK